MTNAIDAQAQAGAAVYSRTVLAAYDWFVLGFSNRVLWRCPTVEIAALYDRHLSANHLDVGVGSGYFLDRCKFPSAEPRLALMDLNATALEHCARRVARYRPLTVRHNVLTPLPRSGPRFDSIALGYLLHCLPGALPDKAVVFDHLAAVLAPGGVIFGSTLLQGDAPRSWPARRLMDVYNRKGIFSNREDDARGLRAALEQRFDDVQLQLHGCAALFAARGREVPAT